MVTFGLKRASDEKFCLSTLLQATDTIDTAQV